MPVPHSHATVEHHRHQQPHAGCHVAAVCQQQCAGTTPTAARPRVAVTVVAAGPRFASRPPLLTGVGFSSLVVAFFSRPSIVLVVGLKGPLNEIMQRARTPAMPQRISTCSRRAQPAAGAERRGGADAPKAAPGSLSLGARSQMRQHDARRRRGDWGSAARRTSTMLTLGEHARRQSQVVAVGSQRLAFGRCRHNTGVHAELAPTRTWRSQWKCASVRDTRLRDNGTSE